jgi:hypothetical protein
MGDEIPLLLLLRRSPEKGARRRGGRAIVAAILRCARTRGASIDRSIDRVGWLLSRDVLLKFSFAFPSCFSLSISIFIVFCLRGLNYQGIARGRGERGIVESGVQDSAEDFRVWLEHE